VSGSAFSWRAGGCHCGGVRFEVALAEVVEAQTCNCSMCAKTGFVHIIVPESRFRITKGAERLAEYTFNTRVARHLFCAECGIKAFYRPRSNPDGWSVNARCLDSIAGVDLDLTAFDGRNWEANAHELTHLSKEPA
jgi:hypothetical protein